MSNVPNIRFVRHSKPNEVHVVDFVEKNLNILAHAQAIEILIGSRCGGHGICGGDRVLIPKESDRKFFSAPTEKEIAHLSPEDLQRGVRLACQCYPNRSDVSFEIEMEPDGRV